MTSPLYHGYMWDNFDNNFLSIGKNRGILKEKGEPSALSQHKLAE